MKVKKVPTRKLTEKFEVGKKLVTILLQHQEEIKKFYQEGCNVEQHPKTGEPTVDQVVFHWFTKARNIHLPISGPINQAKVLEVAQSLGLNDFKASSGWLERFYRRHDINYKAI